VLPQTRLCRALDGRAAPCPAPRLGTSCSGHRVFEFRHLPVCRCGTGGRCGRGSVGCPEPEGPATRPRAARRCWPERCPAGQPPPSLPPAPRRRSRSHPSLPGPACHEHDRTGPGLSQSLRQHHAEIAAPRQPAGAGPSPCLCTRDEGCCPGEPTPAAPRRARSLQGHHAGGSGGRKAARSGSCCSAVTARFGRVAMAFQQHEDAAGTREGAFLGGVPPHGRSSTGVTAGSGPGARALGTRCVWGLPRVPHTRRWRAHAPVPASRDAPGALRPGGKSCNL